jgi:cell division septation protein DedD
MSVPVMKPERRRIPRVRPEGIAYINFEGDNGGIVVNVSEEGLCFQSVAPMLADKDRVVRFWFSAEGNRIDAQGRLAWIDDKRKTGGVQFNDISPTARLQIHNWIMQSTEPFPPAKRSAARSLVPAPPPPPGRGPTSLEQKPGPSASVSTQQSSPPPATAKSGANRTPAAISAASTAFLAWLKTRRVPLRWTEYSRGLATGLLISVVVLAGLLFRANRRQIGELLIRAGERFGATPQARTLSSQPVILKAPAQNESATLQPSSRARATVSQPRAESVRVLPSKSEPKAKAANPQSVPSMDPLPMSPQARSVAVASQPGKAFEPDTVRSLPAKTKVLELTPTAYSAEPVEDSEALDSAVPLGKYFQVGKFSDALQADEIIDKLAHTGYHGVVVPKNLLWMASYQVLAGPFRNERDAQLARRGLRSEGFKARSLPRESREFWLPVVKKLYSDVDVPEGFVVNWESYGVDATVKFVRGTDTVTTAHGTWVKRNAKYDRDGVMYDTTPDGSRKLLEIWFRGMDQSLVFPAGSESHGLVF